MSVAAFTWTGCQYELKGEDFVSSKLVRQSVQDSYLNLHLALEALREEATAKHKQGPRVLIVGPTDTGKSTLATTLVNYAVRSHRTPAFVDLDIGQGTIGTPGTIGASVVRAPLLPSEKFSNFDNRLLYYYGFLEPSANRDRYNLLVSRLNDALDSRMSDDSKLRASGCIINTCGWADKDGIKHLADIAERLHCNVIVSFLSHHLLEMFKTTHLTDPVRQTINKLFIHPTLSKQAPTDGSTEKPSLRRYEKDGLSFVELNRSNSVLDRSRDIRRSLRDERVFQYFRGIEMALAWSETEVDFGSLTILSVPHKSGLAPAALPHQIGSKHNLLFNLNRVDILDHSPNTLQKIVGQIGGVLLQRQFPYPTKKQVPPSSLLPSITPEDLCLEEASEDVIEKSILSYKNVVGLVAVKGIKKDNESGQIKVVLICPATGPLPSNLLIFGNVGWQYIEQPPLITYH
ncbi:putative Protein CLP1 like protein [Blattamonas nauphoetae]|uniref:Protein CLP1 homolog n=1 Tax=Blattamonas nauphoetae TaxID=2049346 RepID=A0ABQ9YAN9_9EUKA|nr:putative Protein CLP1 like protein [Blattamonas nauphoetae]